MVKGGYIEKSTSRPKRIGVCGGKRGGRKRRNQDLSGLDKKGERRMAGHLETAQKAQHPKEKHKVHSS
jgi:hypothetical protein